MLRPCVTVSLGLAAGLFGYAVGLGISRSWLAGAALAAMAGGAVAWWCWRRLPLDPTACSRALRIVACVATVLAFVQLGRLAVFIVDPSRVAYSFLPSSRWEVEHSCLTAYFVAADSISTTPNVYDNSLYSMPDDDPAQLRKPKMLGPFRIDVFEYPPQFLLLSRVLHGLAPDFFDQRMLWFGLNGVVVLLVFLVVARLLGPAAGTRAILLSTLVWAALPMTSTLQKGNVQALAIAGSMLAMVLFERRWWAAGGALLAFATVSKLFPGLLVVYLIARREWRAVAWTFAMGVTFSALALWVFGWPPYAAFLEHLPRLLGGEAFPAFRNPMPTAMNLSIPGLALKLKLFGIPGSSFGAAKLVGWAYTLVAVAATFLVGSRTLRDDQKPLVWLAILILATLRSPFLPPAYGVLPALWLLTLLAAVALRSSRVLPAVLVAWVALCLYWPVDWPIEPRLLAILFTVPLVVMLALVVLAFGRARGAVPSAV
jgi:alpha-1,2-mannosyltransferase